MSSCSEHAKRETVFLVDYVEIGNDCGLEHRSDCPRAFTSFDAALTYVAALVEDSKSYFSAERRADGRETNRYVIREYEINPTIYPSPCLHAWEYDIDGQLLREEPENVPEPVITTFTRGDIVQILPRLVEPDSPSFKRRFGVVETCPCPETYRLFGIHKHGHLEALDVASHCLRLWEGPVPSELLFLQVYSEHLKGIHPLPESVTQYIRPGDPSIIVSNSITFDFERCRVRPPYVERVN